MILKSLSAVGADFTPMPGNLLRRLTLLAAIAGSVVFGLSNVPRISAQSPPTAAAPLPSFEVASIKPNRSGDLNRRIMFLPGRLSATGITAKFLISMAYGVKEFQVSGGPGWIDSQRYDLDAKEEESQPEAEHKLPFEKVREHNQLMMQSLLADRFKLKVSHQTKELPIYALVVAKNGPSSRRQNLATRTPTASKVLTVLLTRACS